MGDGRGRGPVAVRARVVAALLALVAGPPLTACTSGDATAGPAGSGQTTAAAPSVAGASGPTAESPGPSSTAAAAADPSSSVRQDVTQLLAARATALAGRDRLAWLATVADPGSAFGADQAALYDRLVGLPVTGFTARDVTLTPAPAANGDWDADVTLAYRFEGYDQGDRTFRTSYAVSRTAAGWRLAGPGPGPSDPQPFDLPGARSVRSSSTLVIGDVPDATLRAYLALGDAARPRIAQAWGSAQPGVIVAPRTLEEFQSQLGRTSAAGLDQVAAVTDGPLSAGTPAQSDRVYLNPQAFGTLSATGRKVVVTHELTHVTVRGSTTGPVPLWLSEGYADDVGFASSGLAPRTVAADLLAQVRAGQVPTGLPSAQDFDPTRASIAPVYNEAWLAVVLLRQTYGASTVRAFYRAVADGSAGASAGSAGSAGASAGSAGASAGSAGSASPVGTVEDRTRAAFGAVVGVTQDAFVTAWRADLVRLAG